ncbi:MAG: hypothetical protein JWP69_647 [Flaviaesturariibacter sp.]|nr:hypothetical protein [Flaviaesturariibacter sp.]
MDSIIRLLLFVGFFGAVALIGAKLYFLINGKIQNSQSSWGFIGYALLLFALYAALFFGSLVVFVMMYDFLVS